MEILLILVVSAIITYLLFYFTGGKEILLDEMIYFFDHGHFHIIISNRVLRPIYR